jgi:hypothetical protein
MSGHHFDPSGHYAPRQIPTMVIRGAQALTVLGVVCFLAGLFIEGFGVRVRAAYLVNLIYFNGLTFGGMMFAIAMTLTLGRWGRPLKRIAEGFVLFAPVLWVLTLVFFLTGGLDLYEWHTHPGELHGHKAVWLTDGFFVVRVLGSTGLLALLGLVYVRTSLRPDLGVASEKLGGKHPGWWGRITQSWQGEASEVDEAHKKMMKISPPIGILFALVMSFYAFDMSMSLAPHWYSNMFGGWYFASSFWTGLIWLGLFSLRSRKALGIEGLVTPTVYHDLGKLVFAFSLVWAYMFFAQLLPIWYGNMTEEIGFLLVRMKLPEWTMLTRAVGVLCFLFPFITLLSRGLKKMPLGFSIVLGIVATGIWLERFIVAVPSLWTEASVPLGPLEIGVTFGFIGAFIWVVSSFISQVPAVPVTDPYMQPNPADVHVHPTEAGAAH